MIRNLEDINNWLVENFDYFYETEIINNAECEDCKKNNYPIIPKGDKCKNKRYKEELAFYEYYKSLQNLLKLEKMDNQMILLINEYSNLNQNELFIERWLLKTEDFYFTSLNNKYFENIIKYQENKIIGIKPADTIIYKRNPFFIPTSGFENIINFKIIFDKYFDYWK